MAISINPLTFVIYVPRADLTLLQASPEVRELNLNDFRLELKDYEDDPDFGIFLPKTHTHNTEVTLSGLTYARIVEILNPYTVEFEDGQYAVNCTGANHNVSDVKVANQVSLIVNNAAGLISNAQIEYSSFNGGITVDLLSPYSGTTYPTGTPQKPVNNFADALLLANTRGFTTFYVKGDATINNSNNFDSFEFIGESITRSELTISSNASTIGCEFSNATITGTLDGNNLIKECSIIDLTYVNGHIMNSGLIGNITLDGNADAVLTDCYTIDQDVPPIIDMGVSGQSLSMPNYSGLITIENLSDANQEVGIGLDAGMVVLDSTITSGTIIISGIGVMQDNSTGTTIVNSDGLISKTTISNAVWDEVLDISAHNIANSAGRMMRQTAGMVLDEGIAQGNGNGYNQLQLSSDSSSASAVYDPSIIVLTQGTGAPQARMIYDYNGTTKTVTIDRDWRTQPDNTTGYIIYANPGREHVNEGLIRAATSNTAQLNTSASDHDNAYSHQFIFLKSGEGSDQVKLITDYNGTTKTITIEDIWDHQPNTTTGYVIIPSHTHPGGIADAVWDETLSDHVSAGSTGDALNNISGGSSPSVIASAVWADNSALRLLGLVQENQYIDQNVYDANNHLTSARLRTYSNPASVGTDNDVIATYIMTASWTDDQMNSYAMVKV